MATAATAQPLKQVHSPQEAIDALTARLSPVPSQSLDLSQAAGRILAQTVTTDRPSPAADVSAMDGYALRLADAQPGAVLPVCGEGRIGCAPPPLPPGQTLRIVTGGPVPVEADTIIRREDTIEHADRITLPDPLPPRVRLGAHIRRKGENAEAGAVLASPGMPITAALAGALATVGCAMPLVHRRVRVGILVTGDEVLPIDAELSPYQLRDSNGPALGALLASRSWIEITQCSRAADDRAALSEAMQQQLAQCDCLIVTGGVSMGNRDFVPLVLEQSGGQIIFHRVPQRPGKPVLGAVGPAGQAILALPGNPVSVLVTARRMAIAVLRHLAGFTRTETPTVVTIEQADHAEQLDLWHHRLVRLTGPGSCEMVTGRGSGDIIAAGQSDGFVELPPGQTGPGPWPLYRWCSP